MSVCVYMYAYVHIKAQTYILNSSLQDKTASLDRKIAGVDCYATDSQGRDWTKIRNSRNLKKKEFSALCLKNTFTVLKQVQG